jgi:hypothetical protein
VTLVTLEKKLAENRRRVADLNEQSRAFRGKTRAKHASLSDFGREHGAG